MSKAYYMNENNVLINYSHHYMKDEISLVNSVELWHVVDAYLREVAEKGELVNQYLFDNESFDEATNRYIKALKSILMNETYPEADELLSDKKRFTCSIEDLYLFFRRKTKIAFIETRGNDVSGNSFMQIDNAFNELILRFYRHIQEGLQGYKNNVYRQLNPASNACAVTRQIAWHHGEKYAPLKDIPFITTIMLRSPLILRPFTNKREGFFEEMDYNPIRDFKEDTDNWYCYPAKIGESLAYIYFHQDFVANGISLANLFEMARPSEIENQKPDLICLFGEHTPEEGNKFFYDEENDIYVGQVSYRRKIEYFGYMKKMCLTLHNLSMLAKKRIPIHGAMVQINLKDGRQKKVAFMGDSGAGKSETIEALQSVSRGLITSMDVIFDDMGSFAIDGNRVYAQGTEIGAFIRLDDLEVGTAYRDMDRSIFMNPESSNARVIVPASSYDLVVEPHDIDMFLYANNYDDKVGIREFETPEQAEPIFVEGKRKALGTTDESGISTTFFANPFGPQQRQAESKPLIDATFKALFKQGTYVGEIYTRLGYDKSPEAIHESARQLLDHLINEE
ncbi:phosphoenolpyruvate carboxykinase [Bavariicoccus seileri]|nr:phosphoenolpyruvate carboxykinase [Bavariicoccus seileri]